MIQTQHSFKKSFPQKRKQYVPYPVASFVKRSTCSHRTCTGTFFCSCTFFVSTSIRFHTQCTPFYPALFCYKLLLIIGTLTFEALHPAHLFLPPQSSPGAPFQIIIRAPPFVRTTLQYAGLDDNKKRNINLRQELKQKQAEK